VRFSMKCFVRRYQPELLDLFEQNKDLAPHPEDEYVKIHGKKRKKGIAQQMFPDPDYIISE